MVDLPGPAALVWSPGRGEESAVPHPDLIIRTSGEYRSSSFLIWQGAFSRRQYSPRYWPDFEEGELEKVIREHQQRSANGEEVPG